MQNELTAERIEEALHYLVPIYDSAHLDGYKRNLGTALAALRAEQESELPTSSTPTNELRELSGITEGRRGEIMGKQTTITCDKCGKNLAGDSYAVLSISTVKDGKRSRLPPVWLCIRCWMQMRAIVESDANEVDDIIAMEYQRLKTEPSAEQAGLSKPLYPGDSAWVLECKPQRSYSTNCYDRFSHEWLIRNTGTQAWHRRKLVLTSNFKNGPAVSPRNIEIPDTEAGKDIKIAIDINAGGGEGRFELCWVMQDGDGNDCFPNNKHLFCVSIDIKFEAK